MNRVKELRLEKGMRQIELAQTLDVSQATLSNWERGVHNPDNESLTELSKIFGCSIDYLLMNSPVRYPLDEEGFEVDRVYYRIVQEARNAGLDPEDLELAIDFLKRAKARDQN